MSLQNHAATWILGSIVLSLGACRAPQEDPGAVEHTRQSVECVGLQVGVTVVAESVPPAQACEFLRTGLRVIADSSSSTGIAAGDTALVARAIVDEIAQIDTSGVVLGEWWLVVLPLAGRPYDVEVRIDKRSSLVTARPVHK